ncbi:MAG: hypothetical protein ABSG15_08055 [FCB group bacterium]|jgi:hypothetical protein
MYLRPIFRITGIVILIVMAIISGLLVYWYTRPNESKQRAELSIETWEIVNDGKHNAFTDLVYWKGSFYLAYTASHFHSGSIKSKIVIMTSTDAKKWKELKQLDANGNDIRDPKFAIVKNRLFLFALENAHFFASPTKSVYSISNDGRIWSNVKEINYDGWLIWRPKTSDSITWYAPFYWKNRGESFLLKSSDFKNWSIVSKIYRGDNTSETEITFLNDSTLIAVGRMECSDNIFESPEGFTIIFQSSFPYNKWSSYKKSFVTRLDGPVLFTYKGNVYAIGRYQSLSMGLTRYFGGLFSRKRTAIFIIKNYNLIYLSDLLSGGDTSYPGVVIIGDELYFSYYTSDITKDYPWVLGMFNPTSVRVGRLNLKTLEKFANSKSIN